jgi:two-component system, LytTR family, sensor kinase
VFSNRYRFLYIFLLSAYSYLNILFTVGDSFFDFKILSFQLFGVLSSVVFGIWELNRLVEKGINKNPPTAIHPLIVLFFISMINVVLVSILSLAFVYVALGMPLVFNFTHVKLLLAFGFRVNLFLNCVNAIVYFMNKLKKSQLEAEQLKKISIEAQFEALRNQINPHFLFNCFNVLSSLVYKDADTSSKFIAQLSNVYRYLLYNQEKKVVLLKDELGFIESYLFLLKIRFGENIVIENKIDRESEDQYVAPAVLQMLIENAIKHNVVSRKNPLRIRIFSRTGFIVIANNLQEKETKEESTQVGLQNIQSRYEFLSDEKVKIEKTELEFKVSIPLLQLSII